MESENNNNNNENNINTNDFYHEDNSFNENGISTGSNDNSSQFSIANRGNSKPSLSENLGFGTKNGFDTKKSNLALGLNGRGKNNPIKGQKPKDKNNAKPSNNNKNPAKGQNNSNKRKNPLPGGINKDKKDNNNKNTNKPNQNDKNKEKNKGFGSKLNPLNRGGIGSKLGLGKKKNEKSNNNAAAPNLNQVAKKGLKLAWTAAPIQIKILIVAFSLASIIIIILVLILFLIIFGGTAAAITASMCGQEGTSGSSYNGEGYTGENNAKAFACTMQHPAAYKGTITSLAGPRWGKTHAGVDIGVPVGTNIYAGQAGVVITASYQGSYGNLVVIKHSDKITTKYAHNSKILVKVGDKVGKGQLIAKSGNTGRSTGPHTHIEITYNGKAQYELENSYFNKHESFKKNCGSSWDGELAGDSAKQANDTSGVEDISSDNGDNSSNEECCDTSSSYNATSGDYCPNGIVVKGVGTLDLDEYVAGVVSAENSYKSSKDPDNIEAMKAQAIASRTYAVNSTNNCTKKIGNSQSSQVYTNPNERAKKAVTETAGAVMTYEGNVFSAQYDAFCMNDKDCPDASCSGTTCSVTYTKVPSRAKHKITVKSPHSKNVYSGGYNGAGHAHGMSQLVARQMQDEGKKYDEILKFFYADGISISGISSNQCTLGRGSFDGKIWYYDQTDYNEPYGSYGTIATHGCGPTAMAIAVSSLLNEKHDPVELTNYACSNNYCTNGGTKHSFFAKAGKKYGLKVKRVSKSNSDEIFTALNGGNSIVIAIMGPGTFTNSGHFITLTGSNGNQVFVHDPNNGDGKKYNKLWDFDLIKKEASGDSPFWIISK